MANLIMTLTSTELAIANETYYQVVEDLAKVKGDTMNVLLNSMETSKIDLESNAKRKRSFNTPITASQPVMKMRVVDDFDEDSLGTTFVNMQNNQPLYFDRDVGCFIAPIYITTNLNFEFTYQSPSKSDIEDMRELLLLHLTRAKNTFEHTFDYSLILPHQAAEFISAVYERKNRLYPIPFNEYVNRYTTPALHLLTDMSNEENIQLAIRERQTGVFGFFEFVDSVPERDTNNDQNTHSISFSYRLQVEMPKYINLRFPVQVCNRPMPDPLLKYVEEHYRERLAYKLRKPPNIGITNDIMSGLAVRTQRNQMQSFPYPINIPIYDYEVMSIPVNGYGVIVTILIEVDETDNRTLFNLRDLGDYYIPKPILKYIKNNSDLVTKLYGSFIYIALEQEGHHFANEGLEIDDDLTVRAKEPLDLMKPVRVTIRGLYDITYLHDIAVDEIVKDDEVFDLFLNEYIVLNRDFSGPSSDYANSTMLAIIIRKIRKLLDIEKYNELISLIDTITKDENFASKIGEKLYKGFPGIYKDLVNGGFAYINDSLGLKKFPIITEDCTENERWNIRREIDYALGILKKRINSSDITHSQELIERSIIRKNIPLTVMNKGIIAYRKE